MTVSRAARRPRGVRLGSLAAAVLLCLAAGCGDKAGGDSGATTNEAQNGTESDQTGGTEAQGSGDQNAGGDENAGGGGDAVGAPKPHKGRAKGSPIKLPARVQDRGATLSEEIPAIRG